MHCALPGASSQGLVGPAKEPNATTQLLSTKSPGAVGAPKKRNGCEHRFVSDGYVPNTQRGIPGGSGGEKFTL